MAQYRLIGTEMSYFSGKARSYLRWKGVDFEEVPPTPDVMKDEVIANIGWPVIPVLRTPEGTYVQDTFEIIEHFEEHASTSPVYPASPLQTFASLLIQLYADEWLVLPSMHYRWNHNEDWVYGQFGANAAPGGTPEEQYEAGKKAGARFKGALPVLGISEATVPGIEAAYLQTLKDLSAHLDTHPFLFGARASFADFCMMGALYAHMYRDPASGALMKREAPQVADYVERTMAGAGREGALLDGHSIPDTVLPLLQRQMKEQLPMVLSSASQLADWAVSAEHGAEVPRGFGPIPFQTGDAAGTCVGRSFPVYRLQNAIDRLGAALEGAPEETRAFLDQIGGTKLLDLPEIPRLARRNYRLCLA